MMCHALCHSGFQQWLIAKAAALIPRIVTLPRFCTNFSNSVLLEQLILAQVVK
jgi:hypothetical protein